MLNSTFVFRGAHNDQEGPSNNLWHDCPRDLMMGNTQRGIFIRDNFSAFDGLVATNVGRYSSHAGSWRSYEDTGGSIVPLETEVKGALRFNTDGTDNDENWLQLGGAKGVQVVFSDSDIARIWFECSVRFGSIADAYLGALLGFGEEGLAAADTLTDAGAMADKDFLGFFRLEGDGDAIDTVYRKAGQAMQTVKADAITIAANTWYKLGIKYNTQHYEGRRIEFYKNGVLLPDYISAETFGATFPDGEELALLFGGKNGGAAATTMDLGFVQLAMEYPNW